MSNKPSRDSHTQARNHSPTPQAFTHAKSRAPRLLPARLRSDGSDGSDDEIQLPHAAAAAPELRKPRNTWLHAGQSLEHEPWAYEDFSPERHRKVVLLTNSGRRYHIYWPKDFKYPKTRKRLYRHYRLLVEFAKRVIANHREDEIQLYQRMVLCWNFHRFSKQEWWRRRCSETHICPSCNSFSLKRRNRELGMDCVPLDDGKTWLSITLEVRAINNLLDQFIALNTAWKRLRPNLTRSGGANAAVVLRGYLAIDFARRWDNPPHVHGHFLVQVRTDKRDEFKAWMKANWQRLTRTPNFYCDDVVAKNGNTYTEAIRKFMLYLNHIWNIKDLDTVLAVRKMTAGSRLFRAIHRNPNIKEMP